MIQLFYEYLHYAKLPSGIIYSERTISTTKKTVEKVTQRTSTFWLFISPNTLQEYQSLRLYAPRWVTVIILVWRVTRYPHCTHPPFRTRVRRSNSHERPNPASTSRNEFLLGGWFTVSEVVESDEGMAVFTTQTHHSTSSRSSDCFAAAAAADCDNPHLGIAPTFVQVGLLSVASSNWVFRGISCEKCRKTFSNLLGRLLGLA